MARFKPSSPLPMRQGVGSSYLWLSHQPTIPHQLLIDFLCQRFSAISRQTWLARMIAGEVVWENGQPIDPNEVYQVGRCLFYYRQVDQEEQIPFVENIIFLDDNLLVIDKPPFLPVTPGGQYLQETLLTRLRRRKELQHLPLDELVPLHRLDKDTQGLILFSVSQKSRSTYQQLFADRKITKIYHALVNLPKDHEAPTWLCYASRIVNHERFFLSQEVHGKPNSATELKLIVRQKDTAWYQITPLTGKKHQLRLHLSQLGMPIVNDRFYPIAQPNQPDNFDEPLQLIAKHLFFMDPLSGNKRHFESLLQLPINSVCETTAKA